MLEAHSVMLPQQGRRSAEDTGQEESDGEWSRACAGGRRCLESINNLGPGHTSCSRGVISSVGWSTSHPSTSVSYPGISQPTTPREAAPVCSDIRLLTSRERRDRRVYTRRERDTSLYLYDDKQPYPEAQTGENFRAKCPASKLYLPQRDCRGRLSVRAQ